MPPTRTEPRRPIQIDDLLALPRALAPRISPDGRHVVFAVTLPDMQANRNTSQLLRLALDAGAPLPLTQQGSSNKEPAFSPDGRTLAFTSNRSGSSQIWLLPLGGGEPRQLTRFKAGARGALWFPDGKRLLCVSAVYADTTDPVEIAAREAREAEPFPRPRIADELMFRHWDSWTDGKVEHLFSVDVASGAAVDLTPGPYPVPPRSLTGPPDCAISPDGSEICFVSLRDPAQALSTNICLWTIPAEGGEPTRISPFAGCNAFPAYSPDGRRIAYTGMRRAGYEADRREILCYERSSGATSEIAPDFDRSAGPLCWAPDGTALYFAAQDRGRTRLYSVASLGGKPEPLTEGATDRDPVVTPDGSTLVFAREALTAPPELFRVSTRGGTPQALTSLAAPRVAELDLRAAEDFWYEGARGARVHGLLVRPPGFDPALRYPVVLMIHGGPQAMSGVDFHERWNASLLASPGYVVVMINPRGSTGYGQAFTDAIRGEWGGDCYEDLRRGFDWVLESFPFCDGDRAAAVGASFGGFMVNWIAGQTDRFRCLVSHDGMFNTEMLDYATDELWFTEWELGGPPWDAPEAYRKWSPHLHIEKMRTPMLVIQGELDFRCPANEGLTLFTALRRRGIDARLLYFDDEGHWVLKPRNRKVWWETVLGWLDRHLRP